MVLGVAGLGMRCLCWMPGTDDSFPVLYNNAAARSQARQSATRLVNTGATNRSISRGRHPDDPVFGSQEQMTSQPPVCRLQAGAAQYIAFFLCWR